MSIRLTTGSRIAETSSKGNQEKWLADGRWYKLDLFGYEGLAEAVTSALLAQTNTGALGFRYVTYRMERLEVHGHTRNGCSSANFLRQGEAILTLAELLRKGVGPDWQTTVNRLPNLQSRLAWLVEQVERLTGLYSHPQGQNEPPRDAGQGRDRKSTRLNSSHIEESRMPSSA